MASNNVATISICILAIHVDQLNCECGFIYSSPLTSAYVCEDYVEEEDLIWYK